jgi:hypothetical protein
MDGFFVRIGRFLSENASFSLYLSAIIIVAIPLFIFPPRRRFDYYIFMFGQFHYLTVLIFCYFISIYNDSILNDVNLINSTVRKLILFNALFFPLLVSFIVSGLYFILKIYKGRSEVGECIITSITITLMSGFMLAISYVYHLSATTHN